jgi:3-deoxy-manno-octulosonate cytidylyltransferase (CMP-KDO synthetase)
VISIKEKNVIAVIPAHMASVRFPGKILYEIHGLPMIEHVRRRALLSESINRVIVATCDEEIAASIREFGGEVIMTSNQHKNGSSRVAEAVLDVDCSHVIVLQGDEPLLIPDHLDELVWSIDKYSDADAWNATGPIDESVELDRHSFVKCAVNANNNILYCFRRSPGYAEFSIQQSYIRKILGLFAFKKQFLLDLVKLKPGVIESAEFIEQMRILENGYKLQSVSVSPSLPSVNEPDEAGIILDYLDQNTIQKNLLDTILKS